MIKKRTKAEYIEMWQPRAVAALRDSPYAREFEKQLTVMKTLSDAVLKIIEGNPIGPEEFKLMFLADYSREYQSIGENMFAKISDADAVKEAERAYKEEVEPYL